MTGAVSTAAVAAAPANIRVLVRPFNERELRFNPTNILDIGGSSANTDFGRDTATNNNNNKTTVAIIDQSSGGGYGSGYDSGCCVSCHVILFVVSLFSSSKLIVAYP